MNPLVPELVALVLGAGLGYVAHRGGYCLEAAFRGFALRVDAGRMKTYGVAVAAQMAVLPLLAGWLDVSWRPRPLLALVLGAVIFGASMRVARGCATSIWYKAGAGDLGALAAGVGFGLGGALAISGPVRAAVDALMQGPTLPRGPTTGWALAALGGALLIGLARGRRDVGTWGFWPTGLWLAALMGVGRLCRGVAETPVDLSALPGASATSAALVGLDGWVWSGQGMVVGLILGGLWAARRSGTWVWRRPGLREVATRGIGLGFGALLAGGCSLGHGLLGLPLLASESLLAIGVIYLVRAALTRVGERG